MVHLDTNGMDLPHQDAHDSSGNTSLTSLKAQDSHESGDSGSRQDIPDATKPSLPHSKLDIELRFLAGVPRRGKLKSHSRTLSSNKVNLVARPHLSRSKSTDGVVRVKRNNRSYTKLTNLQPLTKTLSNQSLKSNKLNTSLKNMNVNYGGLKISAKQGKAILMLNDDPDDDNFEDLSGYEAEEPAPPPAPTLVPLQQVFQLALEPSAHVIDQIPENSVPSITELRPSSKGPAQGSRDDLLDEDRKSDTAPANEEADKSSQVYGQQKTENEAPVDQVPQNKNTSGPYSRAMLNHRVQDSTEDLAHSSNLYGGSLLLSQSTGLVKKMDTKSKLPDLNASSIGSNLESISGISFKANPIDMTNIAAPIITNENIIKENSYQPNQTIFNNLQRTNSQYASTKKQLQQLQQQRLNWAGAQAPASSNQTVPQQIKDLNGQNTFADFLNSNSNSNSNDSNDNSTRTQQRLWLQRENSLMDVNVDLSNLLNFSNLSLSNLMFAHNYNHSNSNLPHIGSLTPSTNQAPTNISNTANGAPANENSNSVSNINGLFYMLQNGQQNLIQSRIEFERLNREYLNVRRYLNPVGESLNRVKNNTIHIEKNGKKEVEQHDQNANTFEQFSPQFKEKEPEITSVLTKIWQDALIPALTLKQGTHHSPKHVNIRPQMQRIPSNNQFMNARGSHTPTTRKLAVAQAQAQAQAHQYQAQENRQTYTLKELVDN